MTTVIRKRYIASGFIDIEDTEFVDIQSENEEGGAFYSSGVDKCSLKRDVFSRCTAKSGGAITAKDCILMMYSTCFDSCRAEMKTENGGNCAYLMNSNLMADLSSSYRCAPDLDHYGDAVFQLFQTETHATHMNFSDCIGKNGECSFGSLQQSNSKVSYIHVIECAEDTLILLPNGKTMLSNFINNNVLGLINSGYVSVFEKCYFFGNGNNNIHTGVFTDCNADFSTSGVTQLYYVKTYLQTEVRNEYCRFGYCKEPWTNNGHDNLTFVTLSLSLMQNMGVNRNKTYMLYSAIIKPKKLS